MRNLYHVLTLPITVGLLLLGGCNGDTATGPDAHTPIFTGTVQPADNSEQLGNVTLQWSSMDPDGDPVTYALQFGESRRPPTIARGLRDSRYTLRDLERGKKYYWQIVVTDSTGRVNISPLHQFIMVDHWTYPLSPGNYWTYDGIGFFTNLTFENGSGWYTDTMDFHTEVSVGGPVVIGGVETHQIHEQLRDPSGMTFTGSVWSANSDDGLYSYATEGSSEMSPFKQIPGLTFRFHGKSYESIESLLADFGTFHVIRRAAQGYIYDPPVRTLAYPLEEGKAWISNQSMEDFRIDKVVAGQSTCTTPAGQFDAFDIQRLWAWRNDQPLLAPGPGGSGSTQSDEPGTLVYDNDLIGYEYVSEIGMVGRRWEVNNIEIVDYSGTLGFADFHQQWWLTDFGTQDRLQPDRTPGN